MIVVRVAFQVEEGSLSSFREHAKQEGVAARAQPGCAEYSFFEDVAQPGRVLLYEEWESQAAFDAYKASSAFADNAKVLFPLIVGKPSSAYYQAERVGPD